MEESYQAATLARLAQTREPLLFAGTALAREHYAHLDVRRTIASLAYVPILLDEVLIGAIEAISFDRVLEEHDVETSGRTDRSCPRSPWPPGWRMKTSATATWTRSPG